MTTLVWATKDRSVRAGVDQAVIYPKSGGAYPWNGLVSVGEAPSDSNLDFAYQDGRRFFTKRSMEEFDGQIIAKTYPDILEKSGLVFDFTYRTLEYDARGVAGYDIHLVYNVMLAPVIADYDTYGEDVDAVDFSWNFTTMPVRVPGFRPSAHIIISSRHSYSWTIQDVERHLYGAIDQMPGMLTPEAALNLYEENAILRIIDHGDGTWTAIGPDSAIKMLDATTFSIDWPSAVYIDEDTYTIRSL